MKIKISAAFFFTVFIYISIISFWTVVTVGVLFLPVLEYYRTERSINVFCWPDALDINYIKKFEQKTGIKVYITYYDTNEELLVKLKSTQGRGYDLIMPSDYAVAILRKENLLQKLDHSKLPFIATINPFLRGHYFDPDNIYSLPLEWGIFGLGVLTSYTHASATSWGIIFDKVHPSDRIAMVNDAREAIFIAAQYLFGSSLELTASQLEKIKQTLIKQKQFVEAYTELRPDYFLTTKNVTIAVSASPYIGRAMKTHPDVKFILPIEGSFLTIENVAIPASSSKTELVYEFLKFIFSPPVMAHTFHTFVFFPATLDALALLDLDEATRQLITLTPEKMKKLQFFKSSLAQDTINAVWIAVKS